MGLAIIRGLMRQGHDGIQVVDPNQERRNVLSERFGVTALLRSPPLKDDSLVVLAIPPQAFADFAKTSPISQQHTGPVVSVMAGVTLATVASLLGITQVVRSIPNTASEVLQGMTVFCAHPATAPENVEEARKLFETFGTAVLVPDEALLDPATALCGGGPAFVAFFAGVMQAFATGAGFDPGSAARITTQILRGAAELIEATGKPPVQICREVMTPQGTTERGIRHLTDCQMEQILHDALCKSSERSRELGQQFHNETAL
jgi:pyrroline-5-carboxylate reductase